MVANGHRNGAEDFDNSADNLGRTLQGLITEMTKMYVGGAADRPVILSASEPSSPYLQRCLECLHNFIEQASALINEAERSGIQKVHHNQQESARSHLGEMKRRLMEVTEAGQHLQVSGEVFVSDLFSSSKKTKAARAASEVLNTIARYLLLADKFDVFFVIERVDEAKTLLHEVRDARTVEEVEERFSAFLTLLEQIDEQTKVRMAELKNVVDRDDLLAARSVVKSACPLIYSTTKAAVTHPSARDNCEYSHSMMERALGGLESALRAEGGSSHGFASSSLQGYGRLAAELEHFHNRVVYMDTSNYRGEADRADLEEILERIVTGSASIADERSTRTERKHKIINECNHLRQALQDLLKLYEQNKGRTEPCEDVDLSMVHLGRRQKDLRRHLRRAIIDNVGDAFLDQQTPLLKLVESAKTGNMPATRKAAEEPGGFLEHTRRLVTVARLACEMSTDQDGMRLIKHTSEHLDLLAPQVVDAAYLLCENPSSPIAQENMIAFSKAWEEKVRVLTMAVDSLLSLDDFLAVSEAHIVEDATLGIGAVHVVDADGLDSSAGAIRGRCLRVCHVVEAEILLDAVGFSENVKTATAALRSEVNRFASQTEHLITKLENGEVNPQETSANVESFTESCKELLESVKGVRNALLVNRNTEDIDSDNEYEEDGCTQAADQRSTVSDLENQQRLMRRLPEEDKKKIQEQIDVFKITHTKFEREVAKWDETGNDIVVLAKHMCMIMTNMADFTRGRGPLKSTMDVIRAAQEISTAGQKLSVLARQIGDEAQEANETNGARNDQLRQTNKDLGANLSKMTLFCQQLNICSKVKADVQQVGDELVVSGLDSATSLIQTARNLLNAVVASVKNCYIISTKFRTRNSTSRVEWKMSRPRKQPLVAAASHSARASHSIVRRASERRPMPMQQLSEFMH